MSQVANHKRKDGSYSYGWRCNNCRRAANVSQEVLKVRYEKATAWKRKNLKAPEYWESYRKRVNARLRERRKTDFAWAEKQRQKSQERKIRIRARREKLIAPIIEFKRTAHPDALIAYGPWTLTQSHDEANHHEERIPQHDR